MDINRPINLLADYCVYNTCSSSEKVILALMEVNHLVASSADTVRTLSY